MRDARSASRARAIATAAMATFLLVALLTAPQVEADRATSIGRQIRCPVCSGESIADSPASLAQDMMELVEVKIGEGLDDDQVIDAVLAGYGSDAQRLDPRFTPQTAVLWLAPASVIAIGALAARGRKRRVPQADR